MTPSLIFFKPRSQSQKKSLNNKIFNFGLPILSERKKKTDKAPNMKVHFKGTRGSIPTAYTANEINEKIIAALLAARGKDSRSESQIVEFVQKNCPFVLVLLGEEIPHAFMWIPHPRKF